MGRRGFVGVVCALTAFLLVPLHGTAQTITSGVLSGEVTGPSGPLADVAITVTAMDGGATRSAVTGFDGLFKFGLLLPGTYTVLVERLGYRPKLIEEVPVRPGRIQRIAVSIAAAPPPIEAPEPVRFAGDAGASRPGVSQWLSALAFERLPWERRETIELAGLATVSTESLETEGLPDWLSNVRIDGLPYSSARHPSLSRPAQREIALPVGVLQSAELVTAEADGEWSGFAGGALAVNTRRGASKLAVETFGSWSGSGLRSSKFIESDIPSNNSAWGGLILSGPIVRDTAHFVLGLEARRLDTPFARVWQRDATIDAALVAVGHSVYDVDLEPYTRPFLLQSSVVSGFGRFDWQIGNDNALSLRAAFGHSGAAKGDVDLAATAVPELVNSGSDLLLSASLTSKFAGKWAHELRAGLTKSTRDYTVDAAASEGVLPSTRLAAGGVRFGADARLPAEFNRTEITVDQALQFGGSIHSLKIGLGAGATWHDDTYTYASGGEFNFGGVDEFGLRTGLFNQITLAGVPDAKFNTVKLGAFVQDVWHAAPGLHLVAGVRYDIALLPKDDIGLNQEWLTATGLATNDIDERIGTVSPRFGMTWDVSGTGDWVVNANAGRYTSDVDGAVLNEALLGDGDLRVQRAFGDLGGWPTPVASNLPASRTTLTLLDPGFRVPQTDRASFGLSHRLGATSIQLSGTYRRTEFLPRRSDLNLFTAPVAHDQHDRPIFGTLQRSGEIVAVAQPNRRFTNFDLVSGLSADGWSRYYGVTASIEHNTSESIALFASYTRSQTTDNWLIGRDGDPRSQLSPFPDDATDVWLEGTSDLDVPDRVSAGIEVRGGGRLQPRLTAIYRFRSGYPFTPGFREGVDANGDGSGTNDPAFVDDDVAGVSELLASWDCLRDQIGRFAERNACRDEGVHSLNARFGLTLLHSSGTSAELFVDAINLIESTQAEPDRALYLIDRNGSLVIDQATGRVTTPLIANPHFGLPLVRFGAGRLLRIGIQVSH